MSATLSSVAAIIMLAGVSMPEQAHAQDALPNLSGTYRCDADPASCKFRGTCLGFLRFRFTSADSQRARWRTSQAGWIRAISRSHPSGRARRLFWCGSSRAADAGC